jgi:hypothetical protein
MSKLHIISDGTGIGTQIYVNNKKVTNVSKIEFEDIVPNCLVTAKLTFINVELDINGNLNEVAPFWFRLTLPIRQIFPFLFPNFRCK